MTHPTVTLDDGPPANARPSDGAIDPAAGVDRPARDPRWTWFALAGLLASTSVLYLWDLSSSGWANAFYSAAAQAGGQSWKAWFFGSSDAANLITVDKPPASLWVMGLSVRVFGLSSWSILMPQALMGVASVALLWATVRRWFGPVAGLLAGGALALTPVAVLMFRFNNPDALLVLLLTACAYATTRAVERGALRWVALAGVALGLAFLTKSLQSLLVVPALAGAWVLCAPVGWGRRVWGVVVGLGVTVVTAGWWVAAVQLWPASSRPYIGGSQHNSAWELIIGYNGLGRLTGDETGSVGGAGGGTGGAGGSAWGPTGLFRLFTGEYGGQAAWLIPAALVAIVAMWWLSRSVSAEGGRRLLAAVLIWGGWLLVTGLVISFAQGIIHPYYTVALAPASAALVAIGATTAWQLRRRIDARVLLAVGITATAVLAFVLLDRSPTWLPWLRFVVLLLGVTATVGVLVSHRLDRRLLIGVVAAALLAVGLGPAAYAVQTASTGHSGALPSAGPSVAGSFGPGGGMPGGMPGGTGAFPGGTTGTFPGGTTGQPPSQGQGGTTSGQPGGSTGTGTTQGAGGAGGLLDASAPSAQLVSLLEQDASSYTWVAAAVGANSAAGYQLATQLPVMSLGGFNGSDPYPTLAQFRSFVETGRVHWFIAGGAGAGMGGGTGGGMTGGGGPSAGGSTTSQITSWVEQNFTSTTVGGVTVYDLTSPTSGGTS